MATMLLRVVITVAVVLSLPGAHSQECNVTFLDALDGFDTAFFEEGLKLAGFADKLPSPDIGITLLVPNSGAWTRFIFGNGWGFLTNLDSIGDKLVAVMAYHIFPQPLEPGALRQTGEAQTLLTLLAGAPYPLTHYLNTEDNFQILFRGPYTDTVSGVREMVQVCNSWVYVVDRVLMPANELDGVPVVQIPDIGIIQPPPSPSPELTTPASPSPGEGGDPEACGSSWGDAAKQQQGLSILGTVLGQPALAGQLPDPSQGNTLFAPTDTAFFNMLATLNLSISDALALGDQLAGVVLYHVVPGVVSPEQLAGSSSLPTLLGELTGDSFPIGVATDGAGKVTLAGLFPGNTATVGASFTVCSSQVYIIDSVLIPAATVKGLPSPGQQLQTPPPAASPLPESSPLVGSPLPESPPPSSPQAPGEVEGVVAGAGYYAGCALQLGVPSVATTTTNASGWFRLRCQGGGGCGEEGSMLMVRVPGGQGEFCADAATGLPLLYTLQATTPNTGQELSVSPVSTLLSVAFQASAEGVDWWGLRQMLAQQLGIPEAEAITVGDTLQGAAANSSAELAVQGASAQLQSLVLIGASALAGAMAPVGAVPVPDTFSTAIYAAVGAGMSAAAESGGEPLDLTAAEGVAGVLGAAQASIKQRMEGAEGMGGSALDALAAPIATLSTFAAQAVEAAAGEEGGPARALSVLERIVAVAQSEVAPAARQLGEGTLAPSELLERYSLGGLIRLIQTAELA